VLGLGDGDIRSQARRDIEFMSRSVLGILSAYTKFKEISAARLAGLHIQIQRCSFNQRPCSAHESGLQARVKLTDVGELQSRIFQS
jgi:hypothetical protein